MRLPIRIMALVLGGFVLCGCVNDSASFLIDGREHALTLLRIQPYFWNQSTDLAMVVARLPECQRRHPLKPATVGDTRTELFETGPGAYLVKRGGDWYAVETKSCGLQNVAAPAQSGGRPMGVFDATGGRLKFVAAATAAARP